MGKPSLNSIKRSCPLDRLTVASISRLVRSSSHHTLRALWIDWLPARELQLVTPTVHRHVP